mgnify:FL=1
MHEKNSALLVGYRRGCNIYYVDFSNYDSRDESTCKKTKMVNDKEENL